MTKIEKETIVSALSEYAFNHQKAADKAGKRKDYETQSREHAYSNTAMAILEYWKEIVDLQSGTVTI